MITRKIAAVVSIILLIGVGIGIYFIAEAQNGSQQNEKNTVTVRDMVGNVVKVKEPVKRIVSLYGLATQMIYLLGDGKIVVGSTNLALHDGFIHLLDPNSSKRMKLVGDPRQANVEEIEALHPDVVFTAAWGNPQLNKQIEALGIPVVVLDLETVQNYTKSLEIMGKVLQKENIAKKAIAYYTQAMKEVTSKTQNLKNKPRVLLVMYSMRSKAFKVPGRYYFQNRLIAMAGGISVSDSLPGGWNVVNIEQIAKWNPDVIIVVSYSLQYPSTKVKEEIMNDTAWKQLKAVKDGKIYAMPNDGESWDYPAPKWILGLFWLAKVLHPDLFKNLNVKEEANELYQQFYGISIDKVKIIGDFP